MPPQSCEKDLQSDDDEQGPATATTCAVNTKILKGRGSFQDLAAACNRMPSTTQLGTNSFTPRKNLIMWNCFVELQKRSKPGKSK